MVIRDYRDEQADKQYRAYLQSPEHMPILFT